MAKARDTADAIRFLGLPGAELLAAAVVGAAMIVEVAVARAVLRPLLRTPKSHRA